MRNEPWSQDLGMWDVGSFVTNHAEMAMMLAFFNAVRGRLVGFRMKDPKDFSCVDQLIGTGNGVLATYQLSKTYSTDPIDPLDPITYTKIIQKPVAGTVRVTVDGVLQVEGTAYTLDYTTGVMTMLAPHIPAEGQQVRWSGEYDKPARFDVNHLSMSFDDLVYATLSIPVVEIRLP